LGLGGVICVLAPPTATTGGEYAFNIGLDDDICSGGATLSPCLSYNPGAVQSPVLGTLINSIVLLVITFECEESFESTYQLETVAGKIEG